MDVNGYPDVGAFAQNARVRCEVVAVTEPDEQVARQLAIAGQALEIVQMDAWQLDHWPIRESDEPDSMQAFAGALPEDDTDPSEDMVPTLVVDLRAIRAQAEALQVVETDPFRVHILGGLCLHLATAEEYVFRAATWRYVLGQGEAPPDVEAISEDTLNGYVFPDGAPAEFLAKLEELREQQKNSD